MKNLMATLCLIMLFIAKGFGQHSIIYGTTASYLPEKYAYLYDQDTKILTSAPIVDHQFSFKLDKPEKLKVMTLYFGVDLVKTRDELIKDPNFDSRNGTRVVALEDTVQVSLLETARSAAVKGGRLNRDIDDMFLAIKQKKYEAFFAEHPNSPIAIVFLKTLATNARNSSAFFSIPECKGYYAKLSEGLKNSDEGKELLAIMDK
ncbi:hypothetical protein VRU48_14340 [Pedobacter sp. KR3-3]|uniref:DUF4369 domain-containing protein n=1 Tax=Pedobacter albus TaxID=3113905 RepID=A0ABU7IA04_9SPHI|nr:hypothetical protein [Pedobacter sp. KR3-3]MEE1946300.1 hypothetical protein [Pedobacter sp. KR3-3]